jgi:pseudouridine kinase
MTDDTLALKDGPVLVIGAAGVDVTGLLKEELRPGTSTPAEIRTSYGGVARNVAENLARLGGTVTLLTAVGSDQAGDRLLAQAADAGVDVTVSMRSSTYPTGAYLAAVSSNGQLQYGMDDMRAISAITPDTIRQHTRLFRQAALLFIDCNLSKETLRAVVSMARQAHLPVCADPTSLLLARRLVPYLPQLYLITPNYAEAAVFCEGLEQPAARRQGIQAAKALVGQGVKIAIVTMAGQGLCYATSETSGYIPAIRTRVVDPTGAGDALSAAVIFALVNDIPLDDAVRLGVSAASLTLRHPGAVVPDLSLEKLYDQLVI